MTSCNNCATVFRINVFLLLSFKEKGRPDRLARQNDKTGKVPSNAIVTGIVMSQQYKQMKDQAQIKQPETYGIDPLENNSDLIRLRENRYREQFPADAIIFEAVMGKDSEKFTSAICLFQNITIELSH